MNWKVEYYQKENGDIPTLEFLLSLNPKIRAKTFIQIELLEKHGHNLREPYVKPIKGEKYKGIFELRVKFSNDIVRVFYFTFTNNTFIMLNGFKKKIDKTPKNELDKAKMYKDDYEERCRGNE